jgi:hypothetical protein
MSIDKQELKSLMLKNSPLDFCRMYLFNQETYLFEKADEFGIKGTYHELKCVIANLLNTSPNSVAIVGSGKFGFSMNPTKSELLKKFHSKSDLDIVIACPQNFEKIWFNLRNAYYSNQSDVQKHHANDIFSKFIVVNDKMEYNSDHMRSTLTLLGEMKKEIKRKFRIKQTINYRIYSNWSDVEAYHEFGISHLQRALETGRGKDI